MARENEIFNNIINQLPSDNDTYYIEHNKKTDTIIVRKNNAVLGSRKRKIAAANAVKKKYVKQRNRR